MKNSIAFRNFLLVVTFTLVAVGQVLPSTARAGFEVASVKPSGNPNGQSLIQAVPGRLNMQNLTPRRLILNAYGIQDYQLAGDPPWLASEHYDIQATTTDKATVQEMEGPMLQVLLEERLKLIFHYETRELPVYKLVANKSTKMQGSKENSCTRYSTDSEPPPAPAPGQKFNYCGIHVTVDGVNRTIDGKGVTIAELATTLARNYTSNLGKNVLDRTGMSGTFDIHLNWAIDPLTNSANGGAAPFTELLGPSLSNALQDQLGLKLQSDKGPVEVLVIDQVEKASAN